MRPVRISIVKIVVSIGVLGLKWRKQRKLIQPLLSAAFVMENEDIIQRHLEKCVIKLQTRVGRCNFNINEDIHRCASDIVTGTERYNHF